MDVTTPGAGQDQEQRPPQSPVPTGPRPSRRSPASAGAPSLAAAMTTWPPHWDPWGELGGTEVRAGAARRRGLRAQVYQ